MAIPSITRTPIFRMALDVQDSIIEIDDAAPDNPVNGLSYTFANLLVSSSGWTGRLGALSRALAPLGVTSTGSVKVRGALAQTLGALSVGATGTVAGSSARTGALAQTLAALALNSSGTSPKHGSLAQTLAALGISAAGGGGKHGALAQTLAALSVSASHGSNQLRGALAQTLGAATLSAAGLSPKHGALAQTLGALSVSASHGTNGLRGALAQTLGAATLSAAGNGPSAWTPASLTSLAAWYDPSDFATMWQDSAKTTPVTASGQYVGYISDKSANAYDLSQATTGARPQLLTSGTGKLYLNFAGGQSLTMGANSMPNNRTAFCAGAAIQSTAGGMVFCIQHSGGGELCEFSYSNNSTGYELSGRRLSTDGFSTFATGTADTTLRSIIANHDYTGATTTIYVDGTAAVGPSASQTAGSTAAANGNGIAMGGWAGGGYNITANVYQLVLSWGATAGEVSSLNTFLTSKR